MEFIILKNNLHKGLSIISRAISVRSPMEIINNIHIKTSNGGIEITATNLQLTITCWLGASVKAEGEILVPAKLFIDLISEIKDEKIEIKHNSSELKISSENVKTKLNTINPEDYPKLKKYAPDYSFEMPVKQLETLVNKTIFSVASDNSRVVLTGLNFTINKNQLKIVGLDGYRLAEYTIQNKDSLSSDTESDYQFIVPAALLQNAIKSLEQYGVDNVIIEINLDENYIQLSADDIFAQIVLISGEYPQYQSIIPSEFKYKLHIEREKFINGLKLVNVFAKEIGNAVKLTIENDNLFLESQPNSLGQNHYTIKLDKKVDAQLVLVFNTKFLLDYLNSTSSDTVVLELIENLKPGKFTDPETPDYWYIVMPMQTGW